MATKVIIPNDAIENIDYVVCKICGIKRKKLSNHLLKEHNMTCNEYKKMFSDSPTCCINTREKLSKIAKDKSMSKTKEERIALAKKLNKCWWDKYNNMNDEDKQKYRDNLSITVSKGIQENKKENSQRYKEINKKRSNTRKKLFADKKTSKLMRDNARKGAINLWNGLTEEEKQIKLNKLRDGNKKMWRKMSNKDRINFLKNNFSSRKFKCNIGEKIYYFRSKFEKRVAEFLHKNNISFEYENLIIPLNQNKFHLIDFKISNTKTILECKSLFCHSKTETEIIEETNLKKEYAEKLGYNYIIIWYEYNQNKLEKKLSKIVKLI